MTDELKNKWNSWGLEQEESDAENILAFALNEAAKKDGSKITFLTAFGPEGSVIMELISNLIQEGRLDENLYNLNNPEALINAETRLTIANLDTGYQFKETLELKDQLESRYKFKITMVQPELSVAQQDEKHGKDLFDSDPDHCCQMRKIVPLESFLKDKTAWITAIRREQTEIRAKSNTIEWDDRFQIGKINPIITWSKSDVWKMIHEKQIPYNPLWDEGYESIGCEPCTKPGTGREGRWQGKAKTECGLHVQGC